uniref:hypothetical protein n=1 Tax=Acetatifactor sp. TaxID=1872090 RepID=UPI0040571743
MVLNNGFSEMAMDETMGVDGGAEAWQLATVAAIGVLAISCAPAVGVGLGVVKGVAIKAAVGTALTMVGGGSVAIGAVGHAQ